MSWAEFTRSHMSGLPGIDFLTADVLTWRGLATCYVLFFLYLETRRVTPLAAITPFPTEEWMVQMARRAVDDIDGTLLPVRFVLHDRDSKFCGCFQDMLRSAGFNLSAFRPAVPILNAFAER